MIPSSDDAWAAAFSSSGLNRRGLLFILALWLCFSGCKPSQPEVIVYASQDQVYAEPLLRMFTEKTGIEVRTVYDGEAVKTVGLANRLMAERNHPVADVFWGNEELRVRQLDQAGIFDKSTPWIALGSRSRCLVYDTNKPMHPPQTLADLTNSVWKGKIALAYPMFGSTGTHFAVLRDQWGEAGWRQWCAALQANQPLLLEGNSEVARAVAGGRAWVGLTDTDDFHELSRDHPDLKRIPWSAEFLRLPNTVGVVANAPHLPQARRLQTFLASKEVRERLVSQHALEFAESPSPGTPVCDWDRVLRDLPQTMEEISKVFLR